MYEVTFVESGTTYKWTKAECVEFFGKDEFKECLEGYDPCVVAVKL